MPIKTLRIEFWISAFADNDPTSGLCNIHGIEETSDSSCDCKTGFGGDKCFARCEEGKFGEPEIDGNLDNCLGIVFFLFLYWTSKDLKNILTMCLFAYAYLKFVDLFISIIMVVGRSKMAIFEKFSHSKKYFFNIFNTFMCHLNVGSYPNSA